MNNIGNAIGLFYDWFMELELKKVELERIGNGNVVFLVTGTDGKTTRIMIDIDEVPT